MNTIAAPATAPVNNAPASKPAVNPTAKTAPVADPKAKPANTTKPNDPAVEKYKVNIDGKDVELTLDELKSGYGHHKAAEAKMFQAAEQRKQAAKALEMLKTDPLAVMKQLGIDPDKWLDTKFQERTRAKLQDIARKQMTPDQIAQLERNEKLAKYEAAEKAKQDAEQATRDDAKRTAIVGALTSVIDAALDKVKLPKTKDNYRMVARELKALNVSDDDVISGKVDLSRLVSKLSEATLANFRALTNNLDPDLLAQLLNDDELTKGLKAYSKKKKIELKPKNSERSPEQTAQDKLEESFYQRLSPMEQALYRFKKPDPTQKRKK